MIRKKWLFWLFLIFYFVSVILILVSTVAHKISPREFWLPSFISLFFFSYETMLFVCFLFFWLSGRKKWMWSSVLVFLISLLPLSKVFAFRFGSSAEGKEFVTIMSYNVEGFSWYDKPEQISNILQNIKTTNPDVLCFQEYYVRDINRDLVFNKLVKELGYQYFKEHIVVRRPIGHEFGLAIFSKVPIINTKGIPFGELNGTSNGAFYADIKFREDTLRVFNIHLQSASLREREYNLESKEGFSLKKYDVVMSGINKLGRAFRKRSWQTGIVKKEIENSKHRVVLCGDFNDISLSYSYSQLTQKLNDAYLLSGFGTGSSFAGNIPLLRIDYILLSPSLSPLNTWVQRRPGSDHYPVICKFTMDKEQ